MSSTQRTTFLLLSIVSDASLVEASEAQLVPAGCTQGGVQVQIAIDAGGAVPGGASIGAVLEGTNDAETDEPDSGVSATATWNAIPGGTVGQLESADLPSSVFVGDGNAIVDVTAYRWIRVRATITGAVILCTVSARGKFDYLRG